MKFQEYNLNNHIKRALDDMEIHTPTKIQKIAIPKLLNGNRSHVLAQAKTGTGKTLAFSIPIANQISLKQRSVQAVVLVPTRELCKQVHGVVNRLTKYRQLKTVEVYGGVSIDRQRKEIKSGAQIVIATPGRLMDLYRRRAISFNNVKFVVLDEADRMLDMGFLPDIKYILFDAMKGVSPRLLLFSATMLKQITKIARQFTNGEKLVEINVSKDDITVANCKQYYYKTKDSKQKYSTFVSVLREENPKSSIIFIPTSILFEMRFGRVITLSELPLSLLLSFFFSTIKLLESISKILIIRWAIRLKVDAATTPPKYSFFGLSSMI